MDPCRRNGSSLFAQLDKESTRSKNNLQRSVSRRTLSGCTKISDGLAVRVLVQSYTFCVLFIDLKIASASSNFVGRRLRPLPMCKVAEKYSIVANCKTQRDRPIGRRLDKRKFLSQKRCRLPHLKNVVNFTSEHF